MSLIARDMLLEPFTERRLRQATLDAMASYRREERIEAIRELGPDFSAEWLPFAERNRVAPIVAEALTCAFPDGFALEKQYRATYERSARRMNILLEQLDIVAERLDGAGIRMIALKNAGIARGIFPDPALCPMGDLDVLIDRARFREAHQLILECGFSLDSRSVVEPADLEHGLASGGTEYRKVVDDEEVWFELQWRPIAGRWIRRDQEPDGPEMIARSVAIPGTKVRLLCPSDNMIQVCLHTTKHSYVRAPGLRLHTDVDRLALFQEPNWDDVVDFAVSLDVKHATYFSLALAVALLDTPVPEHVLRSLAPEPWKVRTFVSWMRKVDIFEPDQKKFTRPQMIAFHGMLYDDFKGFMASVFDTDRAHMGPRDLPKNLFRGMNRVLDVVTRYQR